MDKRVVIAAAGAGKTYFIANDFKRDEKVILLSFTNSNVDNIYAEILKRFNKNITPNIKILTFDSFIYNYLIKPFEPLFLEESAHGVDIKSIPIEDTRDKRYKRDDNIQHYMNQNKEYYISRLGKLFLKLDNKTQKLIISRLEKYCEVIYIDEFQDYNGYDFKVIKYLFEKTKIKIIAVGDINQSCLVPLRGRGNRIAKQPFYTIKSIDEFKTKLSSKVHYDETSLVRSRRVPQNTCELISNKLGIDIQSSSLENNAIIYLENSSEIHAIITDESIPKLVWNKKVKNPLGCNYINWSYSKGDTYSKSCIILTSSTNNIEDWINISSTKIRNALYVALTRSKGDIYIIRSDNYNKWCSFVENNK